MTGEEKPRRLETRPRCPVCQITLDAYMEISGDKTARPKAGDFSICGLCSNLMVYTGNPLTLGKPNRKKRDQIMQSDAYHKAMRAFRLKNALNRAISTALH